MYSFQSFNYCWRCLVIISDHFAMPFTGGVKYFCLQLVLLKKCFSFILNKEIPIFECYNHSTGTIYGWNIYFRTTFIWGILCIMYMARKCLLGFEVEVICRCNIKCTKWIDSIYGFVFWMCQFKIEAVVLVSCIVTLKMYPSDFVPKCWMQNLKNLNPVCKYLKIVCDGYRYDNKLIKSFI